MKIYDNPKKSEWSKVLQRPYQKKKETDILVQSVFNAVKEEGDNALRKYTEKFDGVQLQHFFVTDRECEIADKNIPTTLKRAIDQAKSNIESFHRAQKTEKITVETMPGVTCWQEKKPIQSVGLYIPGGTAPLFSTILMLAIPATIAGCKSIILCTPPNNKGKVADEIIYTATLCGIKKIYKIGGIQAIAAMSLGTTTIKKVAKIFGPGNQYVTAAKQYATKLGVAIDMPAGPSELLIMADDTANPKFIAADLLSQAEHGIDSQVVVVSTTKKLLIEVEEEVKNQNKKLKRKNILDVALKNTKLILIHDHKFAAELINFYAPEHYIINTSLNDYFITHVENAGSVFIGQYTPESAGDYASGTNHTLPTNGYAKAYSGVNLDSFQKSITFQSITKQGLESIGPVIELMASAEGLDAHKNAVSIRLKVQDNEFE